jgi:hypothetical protein
MMQQGIMSKLDALRQNMGQGQGQPAPAGPAPMAGPPPMGPPPMGPPPMGPAPMTPELMQDQAPEMVAEQPEQVNAGEDAQKLASAVLQRSQGNPQLALDIIEGARGVVMQAIQGSERPQMMKGGGPLSQKDDKLRPVPEGNKGLAKLPEEVRNNMGFMAEGGNVSEALERLNYLRGLS